MRRFVIAAVVLAVLSSAMAREGFWHLTEDHGTWWLVDPRGERDVLRSVEHLSYRGHPVKVKGRDTYPYGENNAKRWGSEAVWATNALARLRQWGFNSIGIGGREFRHRGFAFVEILWIGRALQWQPRRYRALDTTERGFAPSFPNVFDPYWEEWCDKTAKSVCGKLKDDRDLVGYFLDNELSWWGTGDRATGFFDRVDALPAAHTAKIALEAFVTARGGKRDRNTKIAFLEHAAERYFSVATAAVRKYDPNHLILGCRFAGLSGGNEVVWRKCAAYCDALSLTFYPWADLDEGVLYNNDQYGRTPVSQIFERMLVKYGKPFVVAEWSFSAFDSGLSCTRGTGMRVDTQDERAKAAELFLRTALASRGCVGSDYFMWPDWPERGCFENCNYGLVNIRDEPYEKLTAVLTKVASEAKTLHAVGKMPDPRRWTAPADPPAPLAAGRCGTVKIRDDGTYELSNRSGMRLAGRKNGTVMFDAITGGGGKDFGTFTGLLGTAHGKSAFFVGAGRVTSVTREKAAEGEMLLVTCVNASCRPEFDFEIQYRVALAVEGDRFDCEIAGVRNRASRDLEVRMIFALATPPFAGLWKREKAPDLWTWRKTPCDRWLDGTGGYLEMSAPKGAKAEVQFWKGEKGNPHSDAYYALRPWRTLKPGETFRFDAPAIFRCTCRP